MDEIERWWPRLQPATQEWLIDHNGERVPAELQQEILHAGGSLSPEAWWVGESGAEGFFFSDAGIDWIEAAGNSGGGGR